MSRSRAASGRGPPHSDGPVRCVEHDLEPGEHTAAFGVNATGLGAGTISKFVTARLGFRACLAAAAASSYRHTAPRARAARTAVP
jgi:hypothetical protein